MPVTSKLSGIVFLGTLPVQLSLAPPATFFSFFFSDDVSLVDCYVSILIDGVHHTSANFVPSTSVNEYKASFSDLSFGLSLQKSQVVDGVVKAGSHTLYIWASTLEGNGVVTEISIVKGTSPAQVVADDVADDVTDITD